MQFRVHNDIKSGRKSPMVVLLLFLACTHMDTSGRITTEKLVSRLYDDVVNRADSQPSRCLD